MKQQTSGIYKLEWANGYFYIGQASDFKRRWRSHRNGFKNGHMQKHQAKLYNVWLKHGEPVFTILEPCLIMLLNDVEQRYITEYWGNPLLCNTNPSSRNSRGAKRSVPAWNKGIPIRDDVRQRMSATRTGQHVGEDHPMVKLTDKDVIAIRKKYVPYKYTAQMLGEEYGVNKAAILGIVNNKTWTHLPSADIDKNKALIADEGVIEFNGESRNLRQWAKHLGIDYLTLYQRVKKYNWSIEKAFNDASHKQGQKLTEAQILEIRLRYSKQVKGSGSTTLAKEYGVSYRTILYIANGKRYANVI